MNILIAGVGNIFLGDDAFGVEVARALSRQPLPEGVRVRDFGIRGLDLGYELQGHTDAVIILDTAQRGGAPGSLYLIEPETPAAEPQGAQVPVPGAHAMDPNTVLAWIRQVGGAGYRRLLLLCCEPESFGTDTPEGGRLGLSEPVEAAVPRAVRRIEDMIGKLMSGGAIHGS